MADIKDLVEQFQQLHLAEFGVSISHEAAGRELRELADLVRITCKSEKKCDQEDNDKLQEDSKDILDKTPLTNMSMVR